MSSPIPVAPQAVSAEETEIRTAFAALTTEQIRTLRAQCGFADKTLETLLHEPVKRQAKWLALAVALIPKPVVVAPPVAPVTPTEVPTNG